MGLFRGVIVAVFSMLLLSTPCFAVDSNTQPNERILLIHAVSKPSSPLDQSTISTVYDGLVEKLADKGYRIVDKSAAEKCSIEIAVIHDIDPLTNKAASYGLKFFAEYTLFFKTSTIIKDNDSGTGALIRVSAKVIDNTSSRIITAKTADSSSAGLTVEDAIDKAGRSAGKKLAGLLADALTNFSQQSGHQGSIYTLVIENQFTDITLNGILSSLEYNTSVSGIKETESGGGKVTFEVNFKGKRDQLDRELIKIAESHGLKLQKIRSEGNRSSWKIISRGGIQ